MATVGSQIRAYKRDVEKYRNNIARFVAESVRDEMMETAYNAILDFYDSYTPAKPPKGYRRHYYNFKEKSFRPYFKDHGNGRATGGIVLSPEEMDDIYRASRVAGLGTEFVFNLVYEGYHGWDVSTSAEEATGGFGTRMQPTPYEILEAKYKEIKNNLDPYIKQAEKKANKLRQFR